MKSNIIEIKSIAEAHHIYGYEKPKHPLISVIDFTLLASELLAQANTYRMAFYTISFKHFHGRLTYGKTEYDFNEGSLMFTAPNQIISASPDLEMVAGWGLYFHPDLLNRHALGHAIQNYSFFHYHSNEALHISEEEQHTIMACLNNIKKEYDQNIDTHTQDLILSHLEVLLRYCNRFYDRQFYSRTALNTDIVQQFEHVLNIYFNQNNLMENGLPNVTHFADLLHLSPDYLSDLLRKYTGKTTLEHIQLKCIEMAKLQLWSTEKSISQIAYELGFEYPSHFTKFFKNKTGKTPSQYRLN